MANTFYITAGLPVAKDSGQSPTSGVNTFYVSAGLVPDVEEAASSTTVGAVRIAQKTTQRPKAFEIDHSHPLANGLLFAGLGAYSGSVHFRDSSVFQRHAALQNTNPSACWIFHDGRVAVDLDGSDDYVSIPVNIAPAANWWFAAWVYIDSYPDLGEEAMVIGYTSDTNEDGVFINSNGDIFLRIDGSTGTKLDDDPIPSEQWVHICVKYDSTDDKIQLFVNGQKQIIFDDTTAHNKWRNRLTSTYSWSISDGGAAP